MGLGTVHRMSRKLKVKTAILIVVAVASLAVMAVSLTTMQSSLSLDSYTDEMEQEASDLKILLAEANEETEQNTVTYDEIYQSKAESVAFMANNNVGFEATDAKMAEYCELLDVDNVMVVDRDGTIVARAYNSPPRTSPQADSTNSEPYSMTANPLPRWKWSCPNRIGGIATTPPASTIPRWS